MKSGEFRGAVPAIAFIFILYALMGPAAQETVPIAQTDIPFANLAVELSHPVYRIIEAGELRGALTRLSSVKPYTCLQVSRFIDAMLSAPGLFSQSELAMLRGFAEEFATGGPDEALWKASDGKAEAGVRIEATGRIDAGGVADLIAGTESSFNDMWHLNSFVRPYLKGEIAPWMSVWGAAGFTIDKIESSMYLPYTFTKEWDTNHIDFSDSRYSTGEKDYPSFSYDIQQDIGVSTESGSFTAHFSRYRRDWGIGSGSFSLSGTARPFVGIETSFRPSALFAVSNIVGSLSDWTKGGNDKSTATDEDGDYTAITYQKMLAVQRLELFPTPWLTIAASGTMVGAKRLELGYMSPLLFNVMYQNLVADVDNVGVQVDGQVVLPKVGKLYGSFYADEMEITNLSELFTKARNMFAIQGGAKLNFPWLPFATFTAQYTKIEPFVYSHYPTWYADYRLQVDTSYTHDGENIGYHLPPNSDEFLFGLDTLLSPEWRVSGEYSFVRHGDNPSAEVGDAVIFGDVTKWLQYTTGLLYQDKNFLEDGLYDYNHIVKLHAYWRPSEAPVLWGVRIPLELGLGYGLSYTYWDANSSGEPEPAPSWKNIVEVSVKLFL